MEKKLSIFVNYFWKYCFVENDSKIAKNSSLILFTKQNFQKFRLRQTLLSILIDCFYLRDFGVINEQFLIFSDKNLYFQFNPWVVRFKNHLKTLAARNFAILSTDFNSSPTNAFCDNVCNENSIFIKSR